MSNLIPFQFNSSSVRVITDPAGCLWFCAADVCRALDISNVTDALKRLDADEVQVIDFNTLDSNEGLQINNLIPNNYNVVSESGLYSLVLGSRKPEAKPFKRWVTTEVIPSIRKTGSYSTVPIQSSVIPYYPELPLAEFAARMLNMSDTSKIRMLEVIGRNNGVNTNFLPKYVDEGVTLSLTELLKRNNSSLSAKAANLILQDIGVLEKRTRPSSKGGVKEFWVITKDFLQYGKNETSPQNPRETQPLWYVDRFPDLLTMIVSH